MPHLARELAEELGIEIVVGALAAPLRRVALPLPARHIHALSAIERRKEGVVNSRQERRLRHPRRVKTSAEVQSSLHDDYTLTVGTEGVYPEFVDANQAYGTPNFGSGSRVHLITVA